MTSHRKRGPWHPSCRGAEAALFEISTVFSSWQRMALEKLRLWPLFIILESTSVQATHWKTGHRFPLLPLLYENHSFLNIFFANKLKYISSPSQQILVLTRRNCLQTGNTRQYNTFVLILTWKVHHYFIFLLVAILENHLWPQQWWSGCHIRHYLQNQTYWLTFILFCSHNNC